jgi:hypothetical protein
MEMKCDIKISRRHIIETDRIETIIHVTRQDGKQKYLSIVNPYTTIELISALKLLATEIENWK